jgi:hypothetical protein
MPRGVPIDDQLIIDTAITFYKDTEFTGLIGFHYYCEPWAERKRMDYIMKAILATEPAARFLLWTNLAMHVWPQPPASRFLLWTNLAMHVWPQPETQLLLPLFEQVHVTIYKDLEERESANALQNIAKHCPNVYVHYQRDDDRIHPQMVKAGPCFLPFLELSFDSSGKVHACCYDWKGEIDLGNIRDGVTDVVRKWTDFRFNLSVIPHGAPMMGRMAPERCKLCGHRNPNLCGLDGPIAERTAKALQEGEL